VFYVAYSIGYNIDLQKSDRTAVGMFDGMTKVPNVPDTQLVHPIATTYITRHVCMTRDFNMNNNVKL